MWNIKANLQWFSVGDQLKFLSKKWQYVVWAKILIRDARLQVEFLIGLTVSSILGTHTKDKHRQETAEDGMTGLQSGNIIEKDPWRTNINAEVNIRYRMTLNKVKVACEGHISLEVIKAYYAHFVKYRVFTDYHHQDQT